MSTAYIGLGANLGAAQETLVQALNALRRLPGIAQVTASSFYASAPVGAPGPDYVNAVARLRTTLAPHALLDALQAIETAHGRTRPYPNAPRLLDLDLLLYDALHLRDDRLTLPHPRMHQRAFVLLPLLELTPDIRLPQGDAAALLAACADQPIRQLAASPPGPARAGHAQ